MLPDHLDHCRLLGIALGLLVAVAGTAALAADVYRWQDEDGNVHFGSNPPTGVDAERVDLDARSVEPQAPAATEQEDASTSDATPDSAPDAQTAEAPEPEPLSAERCEQLERDYTMLESRPAGILVPDDDGNVRRMSEDEQQERMTRMREQIDTRCP